jgi:hypothetical protein
MTERIVISVSQNAVVQAESAILGCSECAPGATTPFWQIVDKLRNPTSMNGANVDYVLPVLASCPKCRSQVDEMTLVEPAAQVTAPPIPLLLQTRV